MKRGILFLLLSLIAISISAQHYIEGTIPGFENSNVFLIRVIIDSQKTVDTARCDNTGSFRFEMPDSMPDGMYRLISHGKILDIIYHHENISFVVNGKNNNDRVQIISSIENMLYYKYLFTKTDNQEKLSLLQPLLTQYPKQDTFYTVLRNQIEKLQTEIENTAQQIISDYPNTLVAHYVKADKPPLFNFDLSPEAQRQELKKHYFDNVDFADTTLLYSNILTSKIVGYLALYHNPDMKKEELENEFIKAIDTVLNKSMVYDKTYEMVLDYLVGGFESYGFEKVLQHLAEYNRLDEMCENSEKKEELKNRLDIISKLAIGKKAPGFSTEDIYGNKIVLDSIKSNYTVLVFWASWCPHCTETLPELKKYYDPSHPEKLQIVAVSVDENKDDVLNAIETYDFQWINIAELKGWEGKIVEQYGVDGTPTFFILDKNKTIIAKPVNQNELIKALKNIQN